MTDIVTRWAGCAHSVVFGYGGEDGYELKQDGYNENYGCEHPEIIRSGRFSVAKFSDGEVWSGAAVLYGLGKYNDPEVIAALILSCANCTLFRPK